MGIGRYVAAEILVATCALAGVVLAVGAGVSALSRQATGPEAEAARPGMRPRQEIAAPADPRIAAEPSGTFLGMSDDLLLERARTQPIKRMKVNKGGSSLSFRVDFADGSRAAFKPAQTNLQTVPRKEVAAYRINRLLGLNAVPPAAPRFVHRDEILSRLHPDSLPSVPRIRAETIFNLEGRTAGVVSYWIPVLKESGLDSPEGLAETAGWLAQDVAIPPEKRALAAQVSDLVVFDFLICNPDRHSGGNMKISADREVLFFMDNTLAFFLDPDGLDKNRNALHKTQRFSRRLVEALDRLTVPRIEKALAASGVPAHDILTPAEIRAVVARRDVVQKHVTALATKHGTQNVLVFP